MRDTNSILRRHPEVWAAALALCGTQAVAEPAVGIVTFTVDGRPAEAVKDALHGAAINVTVSGRSSTLIDMSARGLDAVVRASVHYYNDETEIDRLVRTVGGLE